MQLSTTVSHQGVHCLSEERFVSFAAIGEKEFCKLVYSSKSTTCVLDHILTKLLKGMLPEVIDPLLNIINSSLSLGYVPKTFKLAMIKPLQTHPRWLIQFF